MDKKLLDALNNLSLAFEELAKSLNNAAADKDKSATEVALSNAKIEKKLELIDKGVKKLQKQNKEIIKNQQELLQIAKSKKDETPAEQAAEPKKKSKIKDGLATIMMIAVGVLAIGLAFKLIGKINFLSVVGLSIAIVIVAFAFERIANMNIGIKKAAATAAVMSIMAVGITVSSWVMSLIRPLSIKQALTAVLLGAVFYFLLPAMASIIKAMESEDEVQFKAIRIKTKGLKIEKVLIAALAVPIIMIAMSFAVTASSWILGMIRPLSLPQLITAVGIGFLFTFLGSALAGIITAITTEQSGSGQGDGFGFAFSKKGISMQSAVAAAILAPIIMVGMALAIVGASWVLGMVKPVGFFKLFTAIMISAAFAALGYGLGKIVAGLKEANLNPANALIIAAIIPVVMIALSLAIAGASRVFQLIKPVGLFKLITAALIGLVFIPLSFALQYLAAAMKEITLKQAAMMPVVLVLLAVAIMASSYLFDLTVQIPFFKLLNIAFQALILAALGYAMSYVIPRLKDLKLTDVLKGGVILIALAAVIMISSLILGLGSYDKYPTLSWTLGVAAAIGAFAFGALQIGGLVFGPQGLVVLAGVGAILVLSFVVVLASLILGLGSYDTGPSLAWSIATAATIGGFAALAAGIGVFAPFILLGGLIIVGISYAIVHVDQVLASGKYDKYPTLEWNLMTLGTIFAFASLAAKMGIFAPFIAIGAFVILGVSYAIVETAEIIATGKYDVYPSAAWSIQVLGAIGAFAGLASSLSLAGIFALIGIPFMKQIAHAIVDISEILSEGKFDVPGFVDWTLSAVLMYTTFVPILGVLAAASVANAVAKIASFGYADPFEGAKKMLVQIAETIVEVSKILARGNYKGGPTSEWASSVSIAMGAFAPIYAMLVKNEILKLLGGGGIGPEDFNQAIRVVVGGIKWAALEMAGFAQYAYPSEAWAKGVGTAIGAFAPVYEILVKSKSWWTDGPTPQEYKKAIKIVVQGITDAAYFFQENKAAFKLDGVPPKKWGERVGDAIKAFTPALDFISKNTDFWGNIDVSIIEKAIDATAWAIVSSASILKYGDFTAEIPKTYTDNLKAAMIAYVEILKYITENEGYSNSWMMTGMASNISSVSKILAGGEYSNTITQDWVNTLNSSVRIYGDLAFNYIYPKRKWYWDALETLGWTVTHMTWTSAKFKRIGDNLRDVDEDLIKNMANNVKYYVELAKWLTETEYDKTVVSSAVDGLWHLTNSYSGLANALSRLNSELAELDVEKLNALKNLNASVVLMSLMDPNNFEEMMNQLEEKGGVFLEALQDLDEKSGEEGKKKGAPSPKLKGKGETEKTAEKTISDLYSVMESVDTKLASIVTSSDKMSKYVDEIRGDDFGLFKK